MILRRVQLIVILFFIWILVIVLPTLEFAPGNWDAIKQAITMRPPSLGNHGLLLEFTAIFLAASVIVLAGLLILSFWRSRRKKKDDEFFIYHENPRATWALYAVVALLFLGIGGLVWFAWHYSDRSETGLVSEQRIETPEEVKPPISSPIQSATPTVHESTVLRWLGYLLVVGLLILLALGAWRILKGRYKPGETELPGVSQIAARAAADLERGGELSDIVLRCYSEMCDILSRKVRLSGEMTAREFAQRLQQKGVNEQEVTKLTILFEQVRYGRYATGLKERKEAIEALKAIEEQYGRSQNED